MKRTQGKKIISLVSALLVLVSCGRISERKNHETEGTEVMDKKAVNICIDRSFGAFRAFDFSGGDMGFSGYGTIEAGIVTTIPGVGMFSPDGLSIPADYVKTVEIRISTYDSDIISVCPKHGTQETSIKLTKDGQTHDYQINLSYNSDWTGFVPGFVLRSSGTVRIESIRLTGVYIVPFPWLTYANYDADYDRLMEIKEAFRNGSNVVTVGFSALVQYMVSTDENGDCAVGRRLDYIAKLARDTDMPVMIWLRNDPWAEPYHGVAAELYRDDRNLMWTEELSGSPAYRENETGYFNFCLAGKDAEGNVTPYWAQTEKLLSQCSEQVAALISANPGCILGVTTTSEYRFNAKDKHFVLDYNPNTIKEFRDWCEERYSDIGTFNSAAGTRFTTWSLRSDDYDPATVENEGGFDAPRKRYTPVKFWQIWTEFRSEQIAGSVQRLVDIISLHIDSKYIWTHQIPYPDYLSASPISTGNAEGSNIGIDFFNDDMSDSNLGLIKEMLSNDPSRTWGVPEWLVTNRASYGQTFDAMKKALEYDVKYLTPFNWGSGDEYDVKGSESERAIRDVINEIAGLSNPLSKSVTELSDPGMNSLFDMDYESGYFVRQPDGEHYADISFEQEKIVSGVILYPAKTRSYPPGFVSVFAEVDSSLKFIGRYSLCGITSSLPMLAAFDPVRTCRIRLEFGELKTAGENKMFSLAEIEIISLTTEK